MVPKVAIITDTTACIPPELVEEYAIGLVPIELIFGDKVYRDGIDITPAQFYAMLRKADKLPTTAGSLPGPYLEAYRSAGRWASGILCITESSKFSGMFNSALVAAGMARESLPDVTIEVLECTTAAAGQGLVTLAAARAAALGNPLAEVVKTASGLMRRVYLFAALDTLYYLIKGGRVPKIAALADSILKIKPVFSVNDGDAHIVALPRSIENATKQILKIMKKKAVRDKPLHVAVMHADTPGRAEALRAQIAGRFNCAELFVTEFTPVIGVHAGPGVIGVSFYSEE